jgi:predicted RNA binding protein YcfA (HicA-like mRNA interferase family)
MISRRQIRDRFNNSRLAVLVNLASNLGYLWLFFALAVTSAIGAYRLQQDAFPKPGSSQGQITVTVYVSTTPARLTLRSNAFLDPRHDNLSVNVVGKNSVKDPWLLVVQCPPVPGLSMATRDRYQLYSEGTAGTQLLGTAIMTVHDSKNWSGGLGCYKGKAKPLTVAGQSINVTLPVLEENPFAQSAQAADTPLYVERSTTGRRLIEDLVEVIQPPGTSCPTNAPSETTSQPAPASTLSGPIPSPNFYLSPTTSSISCYTPVFLDTSATKYYIPGNMATFDTLESVNLSNDRVDSMFPTGQITSNGSIIWQGSSPLSPSLSATYLPSAVSANEATFFAGLLYGLATGLLIPFLQGVPDAFRSAVSQQRHMNARARRVLALLKRDGWAETKRSGSLRVLTRKDQQRVWAYRPNVHLGEAAKAGIARDFGYSAAKLRKL